MDNKNKQRREALVAYTESLGIKHIIKDESWFMRLIGAILFFNKGFMTVFITTIGQTIYWPRDLWEEDRAVWSVLPHELTHAMDFRRMGLIPAAIMYLFPQVLAIFALGAIGAIWDVRFLWFLLALIFLFPWPAPGRKYMEMRGFAMSIATDVWASSTYKCEEAPNWILNNFTGPNYYWMWPFRKHLEGQFKTWITWINDGTIDEKMPLAKVLRSKIQGVQ